MACITGDFKGCKNAARCGHYRVLELSPKTAMPVASTRGKRRNGALDFAGRCKEGQFFVCDYSSDSTEKFTVFAVHKDSLLRDAEEDIAAERGHMAVRTGQQVIDGMRFSCVSAGGTVFTVDYQSLCNYTDFYLEVIVGL